MNVNRRQFLGLAAAATVARAQARRPRILLRSSWQSINIGDVGHTPGALDILAKHFPEAQITLWPGKLGNGSREMLTSHYPDLTIAEGSLTKERKPSTPALAKAWDEADLYLSGSGSGFPASDHAAAFRAATGKPVGVFGVSLDPISGIGGSRDAEGGTLKEIRERALKLPPDHLSANLHATLDACAFFFCRDTISRDYLKTQRLKTPLLEFGPDAQLGMRIRDDAKGLAYLKTAGLEPGAFLCVIPRLRYTPYYRIDNRPRVAGDDIKDAINDRTTEKDMAKLRDLIVAYVKNTGKKVLACPEMTYQIELAKKTLVDPLPVEIRKNVVWRDTFWLPDEAASVYSKATAVVSAECHSPLIALHNGTPAMYVRQPTDTCKGEMYRDIGAPDWLFEIDEATGDRLWSRVNAIVRDPNAAKAKVRSIMTTVEGLQKRMADAVRSACKG
jgi:hypothetical protein